MLVFICMLVTSFSLYGQSKVIELWDGKVPGSVPNASIKQMVDSANNWIKMRYVTIPTLDMYPAPDNKATGTAVVICPGGGYGALAIGHEGAQVAK